MSHLNKLFICAVLLAITDIVQSNYVYRSDAQRWIAQNKIVATWEEAKQNCDKAGAILASPINEQLLKYMKSYIDVNGHTNAYFIGMTLKTDPEPQYVSIEGIQLNNMPGAVFDMIDQLDPRDGNCLSMNRDSIHVVPCWKRLPYICYTGVTTNGTESVEPTEDQRETVVLPTQVAESNDTELTTIAETANSVTDAEGITPTTLAPDCNYEEYVYYPETGRCYRINYFGVSWSKANRTCEDEGGYLVILNDETEAKIVTEILAKEKVYLRASWVGLRDDTGKGEWRSIHGENFSDLYNKVFVPITKSSSHEFCAILLDEGTLYDSNCDSHLSYICEKDAI